MGWVVTNRVAVIVAVAMLTIVDLFTARNLQLDALPDITTHQVVALTRAPGLA